MAITKVEQFLDALEKSGLLDEGQLAEARQMAAQTEDLKGLARALVQKGLLSRWQAAQLLAGRTSVFFLGKYKLIEMLGRGGMGGVFLAQHTMMNRRVALKVVSKQIAQNPAALEQFLAEARAIAALDHPNIVRAYNVDCEDGRYYLVMEYVEGKDLQRLVEQEGPLDFQKVVDYIRQAAEGLAHAHQQNLIHCDIKPSNLLVTPDGVVKILDLGLARWASTAAEQKETGEQKEKETDPRLLGTVDYQAPEVGLGQKVDARADIYSLGCTMFFLLTGQPPFGEGTLHERILKHQSQAPPDIAALRPGVPKDLAAICRKMMAKKPADRFQSAEEVSKLLARWRPPQPKLRKAVPLEQSDSSVPLESANKPSPAKATKQTTESGFPQKPESKGSGAAPRPAGLQTRAGQLPPWLWIVGAAGAVLLVGLVIVWLVRAASWGPQETAKTDLKRKAPGPKVQQEQEESWLKKEGVEPAPRVPQPSPTQPEQPSPSPEHASPPPGKEPPSQPPPKTPPEQPAPKTPEKSPPEQPKGQPSPKDNQSPPHQPAPQPGPEENPKPPEKEPPESKQPPSKPKEKHPAEKPKSQPEPKPPAVTGDFWHPTGLPKPVDLPELENPPQEPIAKCLGKMKLDVERRWYLDLVGGNLVFKGGQEFRMGDRRRTETGFEWDVLLQKGAEGRTEAKPIAQFEYKPNTQELWFRWLPGAEPGSANLLRNCVLDVNYGAETFPILLRTPISTPPIELQPLKPAKPLNISIPYVPGIPERLFWHFHKAEAHEPAELKNLKELEALKHKVVFEPATEAPFDPKKPFRMKILRIDRANNEWPDIVFQLTPQGSGGRFRLDIRLITPKLQELRVKRPLDEAIRFRTMADAAKKRLDEDAGKDPKKRMPEKDRSNLLQTINLHDAQAWFIKMQHLLEGGLTIHYQVLYQLGRYQIKLAESTSQAPAEKK